MNLYQQYFLTREERLNIEKILTKPDGIIAFPTDTVYGLGCLPENKDAVNKIYDIKGRDKSKPLILLGSNLEKLSKYVQSIPENIETIINQHWPGPLTVVLHKSNYVPNYITSGLDSVGIRVPSNPVILEILDKCTPNQVLATTSANLSDQPDITNITELNKKLGNKVDYAIDNKNFEISGLPSTVIAINNDNSIKVLRQGAVNIK